MNLRPLPPQGSALPAAPHPDCLAGVLLPDDLIIIPQGFQNVKRFLKKDSTNDSAFFCNLLCKLPLRRHFVVIENLRVLALGWGCKGVSFEISNGQNEERNAQKREQGANQHACLEADLLGGKAKGLT